MAKTVTKQLDRSLGLGGVFTLAVGAMLGPLRWIKIANIMTSYRLFPRLLATAGL
jgi:hypothetical protein